MMEKNKPIGVFDSGIGGLTVLESLMDKFENEDFIYVGDQGHCPYGTKTDKEIIECVINVGKYLERRGVKAIVIACNTASLFIDYLRREVSVPVISVIEPTCDRALSLTKTKNVAVLATIATINKGKYQERLEKGGATPFAVKCSEFVEFVETKELTDPIGQEIVNEKLTPLKGKNIDTLIHGCTHFSIIEDKMRNVLGDINYVACGNPTSDKLEEILKENDLLNNEKRSRYVKIYTTGPLDAALSTMKWFTKPHEEIKHISLDE